MQRWTGEELNKKFNEWTKKVEASLSEYQTNIQNESSRFNSDLKNYQAKIQKHSTDYQWLQSQYAQLKQDYSKGLQMLIGSGKLMVQQQRQQEQQEQQGER